MTERTLISFASASAVAGHSRRPELCEEGGSPGGGGNGTRGRTERALIALASASVVAGQANSPNSVRKGEVKEGVASTPVGSNTPPGTVLAPFWFHFGSQNR